MIGSPKLVSKKSRELDPSSFQHMSKEMLQVYQFSEMLEDKS